MDDEEVTILAEALQKYTQIWFDDLGRQHNQLTTTITDRLNDLGRTIEEIKLAVECAP